MYDAVVKEGGFEAQGQVKVGQEILSLQGQNETEKVTGQVQTN